VLPVGRLERLPAVSRPPTGGAAMIAYGPAGLMRAGFLAGCVDYLRDPWTPQELALRAEAALSRREALYEFSWGRLRFEEDMVRTPRGVARLTRQQAVILRALLRRRGHPVPRHALACLLGADAGHGRSVDVQVSAIRRRMRAADPGAGRFIVCVRRRGYMIP
jgi:DNA-binding response OmpR family regulator